MKFTHEIAAKDGEEFDDILEKFSSIEDLTDSEKLLIEVASDGKISLFGNKEGWLYLARLCVEMAYSFDHDEYYHTHRDKNFNISYDDEIIGIFSLPEKTSSSKDGP